MALSQKFYIFGNISTNSNDKLVKRWCARLWLTTRWLKWVSMTRGIPGNLFSQPSFLSLGYYRLMLLHSSAYNWPPLTITVLSTAVTWCIVRCYLYSGRAIQTLDRLLRCFKSIIQADKRLPTGDLISLSGSIFNSLLSCPSISFQLGNFDQLTSSDRIFNLIISPWSWWNEESGTSKKRFFLNWHATHG